jgi:short subunit dehydrogenase-like uncharacterized protein
MTKSSPQKPAPRAARPLDIVLWGASGFTGRLVAEYLTRTRGGGRARWALAGRDRAKLEGIRAELARIDAAAASLPILIGDAGDPASLDAIAGQTRVVCSTVGPYARYGSELVAACVRSGTDYCDLTGEVQWIRRMIDAHHEAARASGARIVNSCGFDSIPSDLGVLMVQEEMRARHGAPAASVDAFFGESKGGFSGGTVASLLNVLEEARHDRTVRRVVGDPYALDPSPRQGGPDGSDQYGVRFDRKLRRWTAPFLMAAINTRIVRRSNAVLDYPYGRDFRYREVMSVAGGAKGLATAVGISAALGGFVAAVQVRALRKLIEKRLPAPGEGPSEALRNSGYFVVRLIGEGSPAGGGAPVRLLGKVAAQADPGYGATSKMLAEAALCLALDDLPARGGVLTPASAMGTRLIDRLRKAGMTFDVGPM